VGAVRRRVDGRAPGGQAELQAAGGGGQGAPHRAGRGAPAGDDALARQEPPRRQEQELMAETTSVLEETGRLLPHRLTGGRETHAPWVWVNGDHVRSQDLRLHYFTHALHYGSGVFEGIRCYDTPKGPAIFRLGDHMERLLASSRVYGLRVPYSAAE